MERPLILELTAAEVLARLRAGEPVHSDPRHHLVLEEYDGYGARLYTEGDLVWRRPYGDHTPCEQVIREAGAALRAQGRGDPEWVWVTERVTEDHTEENALTVAQMCEYEPPLAPIPVPGRTV